MVLKSFNRKALKFSAKFVKKHGNKEYKVKKSRRNKSGGF